MTKFSSFIRSLKLQFEQFIVGLQLIKWTALIIPLSFAIGSLVALFLWLLDIATKARWANTWLIFLLPLVGILIQYSYRKSGKNAEAGNNLIMDEIHKPGGGVPFRMTPLILASTILTHLFGGSAGREGTAVQMGGSMASQFSRWFNLDVNDKRIFLMCGMAGGFGAVFGTPVTGAIFSLEVLTAGRIKYDALIPCLISSLLSNIVCSLYGIHHTNYSIHNVAHLIAFNSFQLADFILLAKVIICGIAFGSAGRLFGWISHQLKGNITTYIKNKWLIPVAGGLLIIILSYSLGTLDYLGLGVINPDNRNSIVSAFIPGGIDSWSWFWKLLFTAITLSTGYKGGEVTPLFFIGATLGNTLAVLFNAPVDLFAGLGFIAVFAGATNTPVACTLMGVELFGDNNILFYAIACFTAYYFSGHSGIYTAQRTSVLKYNSFKK